MSDNDITSIQNYNSLITEGKTHQEAFNSSMLQASQTAQTMAINANGATVSLTKMTMAEKAAAVGMNIMKTAGNMLLSMGITLFITGAIKLIDKLTVSEKETAEKAEELKSKYEEATSAITDKVKTVEGFSDEFKKLSEGVDSQGRNISLTSEQYNRYKEIVKQLIEINPNLITGYNNEHEALISNNDALQKTIDLLKEKSRLQEAEFSSDDNLRTFTKNIMQDVKSAQEFIDNFNSNTTNRQTEMVGKTLLQGLNTQRFNLGASSFTGNAKRQYEEINKILEVNKTDKRKADEMMYLFLVDNRDSFGMIESQYDEYTKDMTSWAASIKKNLDTYNNSENTVYDGFKKIRENIKHVLYSYDNYDEMSGGAKNFLDGYVENLKFDPKSSESEIINKVIEYKEKILLMLEDMDDSKISDEFEKIFKIDTSKTTVGDYSEQVDKLVKNIAKTDFAKKDNLSENDIKVSLGIAVETDDGNVEDSIVKLKNNIKERLEKQFGESESIDFKLEDISVDELKSLENVDFSQYKTLDEAITHAAKETHKFDLSSYKDDIDNVQDRVSKLSSALEKLKSGDMSDNDLLDFLQEFPELIPYANDVDELKKHIEELIKTSPNDLIKSLEDLKANLKTDKEIKQVNALISILKKLGDTQFGSNKSIVQTLSADIDKIVNKLNGVVNRHQKIIDNLNDENNRIKDQNEVLQEQLDKYNEIVGKYETTANVVQDYVSKEIEKLENKKQAIEDTYNKEIDKINQRNKETEQSIDLQEKLDALQNAKAKKVMTYSNAKNWHLETDTQAVNEARREYNQAKDDKRIADLESKRDRKTAVYDKQINSLQDYADKWGKAVDSINGKADELIAKEILGANWREKISKKDTSMLKSFKTKYNTYKNVLAAGVQKQIEHNEKAIKNNENIIKSEQRVIDSKQKVISEWEAYKDKLTKNVNSLTKANSDYMKSLSDVALTEQTTFKERAKFLSDYAKSFANSAKIINSATDNKTKISATKVPVRKAGSNVLKGTGGRSKTPFGGVSSAVGKKFVLVRKEYGGAEKSLSIHSSEKSAKSAYNKYIEERIKEFEKSNLGLPQKDFKRAVENFKKNLKKKLIIKSYAKGGTIDYTGIANVHGTPNKSEVVFNSSQAKKLYDIVSNSGSLVSTLSDNVSRGILNRFNETFKNINPVVNNNDNTDNQTNISINVQNVNTPNAKDFMEQMKAYVRKVNRDRIIGRK